MKKSEIENHIRKYILPTHPGYVVDQYVMYKTFEDNFFIKGYLFYSKGDNELGLKVNYFIMPLFVKKDRIILTIGKEISCIKRIGLFKKERNIWWNTRKEKQQNTFEHISIAIQDQGEKILSEINSAKGFFYYSKAQRKDNIRIYEAAAYSTIFFGDMGLQDKMLRGLIKEAENERDVDWVHQIKADAQLLLSTKDKKERIAILKQWANETISHLKLLHLKPFT